MQKESLLYGIIGLLGGSLFTVAVASSAVNTNNSGVMRMMGIHTNSNTSNMMSDESMGMDKMTENLKGKKGDEFDRLFISEMIIHHQGAIDMANIAKQNAKHNEINKLANDIVAAQTKEINVMEQWQRDWGYPAKDSSMNGMHSGY